MHLSNAKAQRSAVKEMLKAVAAGVFEDHGERELALAEYNACIDHWKCDHETTTRSEDLFLSSAHELILYSVIFIKENIITIFEHL